MELSRACIFTVIYRTGKLKLEKFRTYALSRLFNYLGTKCTECYEAATLYDLIGIASMEYIHLQGMWKKYRRK